MLEWWVKEPEMRVEVPAFLRAALPLIAINLAATGMQFVDAYMVSVLGDEALAAVFPAGMMYLIPLSFGWGLMASLNTFVAQKLGQGEKQGCGHYTLHGLVLGIAFGVAMLALWPAGTVIFGWMGHAPEVQVLEAEYFRISLLGAVPSLVVSGLASFFTALLRTRTLLLAAVGATILNIVFNYAFIYGRLGAPAMGLAGSAVGTVLATWCQAGFLIMVFWSRSLREEFGTARWRPESALWGRILRLGSPAGGQFVFDLFMWGVLITWMIGLFGTVHLAANTIVVRYLHLAFMPPMALAGVLTARVGHAIGDGAPARARQITGYAFQLIGIYMVLTGLLFFCLREDMIGLFTANPEIIRAGAKILVCAAVYQIFDAMFLTYSHALRGAGDTLWPAALLFVYATVFLVGGGLLTITFFPQWGSLGPWIATTVYVVMLGSTLLWRWHSGRWVGIDVFAKR